MDLKASPLADIFFDHSQLVDKFYWASVSGGDDQYVACFLVTFRRFTTPSKVLQCLIDRFEFVSTRLKTDPLLCRFTQNKLLYVLSTWITSYPQDFSATATYSRLAPFMQSIAARRFTWCSHYLAEINPILATLPSFPDEDATWGVPEVSVPTDSGGTKAGEANSKQGAAVEDLQAAPTYPRPPTAHSLAILRRGSLAPSVDSERSGSLREDLSDDESSSIRGGRDSRRPSVATSELDFGIAESLDGTALTSPPPVLDVRTSASMSSMRSSDVALAQELSGYAGGAGPVRSDSASSFSLPSRENRNSGGGGGLQSFATLDTRTTSSSDKEQKGIVSALLHRSKGGWTLIEHSNALLEMRDEDVVHQCCRLSFDIFQQLTPRHLLRYVLGPREQESDDQDGAAPRSLIGRAIAFNNHLSDWVVCMILAQPRSRGRVRMVRKFITIALLLRERENYDALMGVLCGLSAQPIYRLKDTMGVVERELRKEAENERMWKRYQSLQKLMSKHRNYAAYRMALSSSGADALPYLGVHIADITVINEIKSDLSASPDPQADGATASPRKVNWSKFTHIGRSASVLADCSRSKRQFRLDKDIERVIIDFPVLSMDEQYTVSYAYEARSSGQHGGGSGVFSRAKIQRLVDAVNDTLTPAQSMPLPRAGGH